MNSTLHSGIIAQQIRQTMYLKHLRQVQIIANRDPSVIRKQLHHYRSVSQLHRKNKVQAKQRIIKERQKKIQQMNRKIQTKILSLQADEKISQRGNKKKNLKGSQVSRKTNKQSWQINPQTKTNYTETSQSQNLNKQKPKTVQKIECNIKDRYEKNNDEQKKIKTLKDIKQQRSAILPILKSQKEIRIPKKHDSPHRMNSNQQCR